MVFCDICDKENCELAEHRKKLKNLCRMCHTTLIKKKTVLIKSLPKLELFERRVHSELKKKLRLKLCQVQIKSS